ncbi:MAG: hypothetical protein IPG79_01935 [Saprospiraceae bacterium]|nr:hypothetical protein [Saprospiraceae bacterium]
MTSDTLYEWTKLLDSADWKKNYNFQMFSVNDTLWTFHPEGTWYSLNGVNWTKSVLPNVIQNHAFLDYILWKGSVYGLGYFNGNIEQFEFKPEIYKTTDFKMEDLIEKQQSSSSVFLSSFVLTIKSG